jgi:hypothetical protein
MADRLVSSIRASVSLALGQDAQHEARVLGAVLVDDAPDGGGRPRLHRQWIDVGGNDLDIEFAAEGLYTGIGGRRSCKQFRISCFEMTISCMIMAIRATEKREAPRLSWSGRSSPTPRYLRLFLASSRAANIVSLST